MIKTRKSKNITCEKCWVKHLCIATDILPADIQQLDELIINAKYVAKKEHIYRASSPMVNLYAVHRGSCKEYWIDENGNECVTNFYFPGDIIGVESISSKKYMFDMVALEDTELCVIPADDFLGKMHTAPHILKRFVAITSQKMINDKSVHMGITANEKVCDFLLNITMRAYERNPKENEMCLTMSQVDIANFLGIASETINRIFSNLKRKKIIKLKNKTFEVIDINELRKLGKLDYHQ
jgi:CRP/FNR family transcriptional regulator, anaerobic regulatory protein